MFIFLKEKFIFLLSVFIYLQALNSCVYLDQSMMTDEEKKQVKEAEELSTANSFLKDGLLREALLAYNKVLRINPNNISALRNKGILLVKTRRFAKALQYLDKAKEKYPLISKHITIVQRVIVCLKTILKLVFIISKLCK